MKKLIVLIFGLSLVVACSKNPFSDGKVDRVNRITIKGTIELSDGANPDHVFVWMEGFNLFAWTDVGGNFTLQLPEIPATNDKLNGVYRIFSYVANYRVGISSITILDGQIEPGQGDVAENGELKSVIKLHRLVEIRTTVSPTSVFESDTLRTIDLMLSLKPDVREIEIDLSTGSGGFLTAMIFLEEKADTSQAVFYEAGLAMKTEIVRQDTNFRMGIKPVWFKPYFNRSLPAGRYKVIPYLFIKQNELPEGLLKAIADQADQFKPDYLKIPVRQTLGTLVVEPG